MRCPTCGRDIPFLSDPMRVTCGRCKSTFTGQQAKEQDYSSKTFTQKDIQYRLQKIKEQELKQVNGKCPLCQGPAIVRTLDYGYSLSCLTKHRDTSFHRATMADVWEMTSLYSIHFDQKESPKPYQCPICGFLYICKYSYPDSKLQVQREMRYCSNGHEW